MSKFKLSMEVRKKDLKDLDKDLDKLFVEMGRQIASAPKMEPMVDKMKQGMSENSMQFTNHPIWEANKNEAKKADIIEFDSPLMVTGQLVDDFIYYAGKPKFRELPYSNEFVLGMFTWAAKERRRPTSKHIINELRKKKGKSAEEVEEKFTFIRTNELVKMIMKSPRFPIMDSLLTLYHKDVFLHVEKLINEAFKKRR